MKRRLARWLRSLAWKLDPAPMPETDLTWVTTVELAEEIARRNDAVIVVYGRREPAPPGRFLIDCDIVWRLRPCEFKVAMNQIGNTIGPHLFADWDEIEL